MVEKRSHIMFRFSLFVVSAALLIISQNAASTVEQCVPQMVETIPDGMRSATFEGTFRMTHEVLIDMVKSAKESIKIASLYISFTDPPRAHHPSTEPGKQLLNAIVEAAKRGVKLEVVIDSSGRLMSNLDDVTELEQVGTVHRLNMTRAIAKGNMHTKFMITDNQNLYLGSSNFDWRSYTQVKEIGVLFEGCKTMATDLDKVFQAYKLMSGVVDNKMPEVLPQEFSTQINQENPYKVSINDQEYSMYMSAAPPTVFQRPVETETEAVQSTSGWSDDLETVLSVIDSAKQFVHASVMSYNVRSAFSRTKKFWPAIDNALRRAAIERKVRVNLLFSDWQNTREEELIWYKSLNATQQVPPEQRVSKWPPPLGMDGGIFVKLFKVPSYDEFQSSTPFSRVKHDKYVVTEDTLYVGTSNWTPEYFENTCGVGLVFRRADLNSSSTSIIDDMQKVFERDFNSEFSRYV